MQNIFDKEAFFENVFISLMSNFVLLAEAADSENIPQWEKDLQKELQDYEMVNDNNDLDDLDIENEILQQIENETDNPWLKYAYLCVLEGK